MSRPAIRTRTLTLDDINRMLSLFGTIKNAQRQLGLIGIIDYTGVFYRAMHGMTITPEHWDEIMDAWTRWQRLFLRDEVPKSDPLAVTPDNREDDPEWLVKV